VVGTGLVWDVSTLCAVVPPPGLYGVVWDVSTLCAVVPPAGLYGVVGTGLVWDVSTLCAVPPTPGFMARKCLLLCKPALAGGALDDGSREVSGRAGEMGGRGPRSNASSSSACGCRGPAESSRNTPSLRVSQPSEGFLVETPQPSIQLHAPIAKRLEANTQAALTIEAVGDGNHQRLEQRRVNEVRRERVAVDGRTVRERHAQHLQREGDKFAAAGFDSKSNLGWDLIKPCQQLAIFTLRINGAHFLILYYP
jgi:hypothetical protein